MKIASWNVNGLRAVYKRNFADKIGAIGADIEFAALIALRVKEPGLVRPFRVRGGYVGLVLLSIPPTVLIVISCVRNHAERIGPVNALVVGLGLILLGVVFYFFGNRQRTAP